jgi:hypothetical protein
MAPRRHLLSLTGFAFFLALVQVASAQVQIADLRLPPNQFSGNNTYFNPGFGPFPTREVKGAPVQVPVEFSGTSQWANNSRSPDTDHIGLRTYYGGTLITQLSRSNVEGENKVQVVGAVQWRLDLNELAAHLSRKKLELASLELRLVEGDSKASQDYKYDIYLSPADVSGDKRPVAIDLSRSEENFRALWLPAQGRQSGDIFPYEPAGTSDIPASGNRKVLVVRREKSITSPETVTVDLKPQFQGGVREFNLILAGGTFGRGRSLIIREGSGLFIATEPAAR